jgi:alpha-glucosidase
MLVAPKVWPFVDPYDVILPKGNWFNYWTGEMLPGGQTLKVDPPLDTLPVYVRAGSIIPQQPVVQNIDEAPNGPLELRVYPGPDCSGNLYMDDGNTFAYQKGEFLRAHFTCAVAGEKTTLHITAAEGTYHPWFKDVRVLVYGSGKVSGVQLDGKAVKTWKSERGVVTVDGLAWTPAAHDVEIQYASR